MFKYLNNFVATSIVLAIAASSSIASADIVHPNGYMQSIGNPGVYVQRWGATGGTTPGNVSCNSPGGFCRVGVGYQWRTTSPPGLFWNVPQSHFVTVPEGTVWNDAVSQWISQYGRSGTASHNWLNRVGTLVQTCMLATDGANWSRAQIPLPATCDTILPAPSRCDFSALTATIDHQTIDKNAADGHTASTNITANCTSSADVMVDNVQGNAPTPVLPGITSTIQIDGRPLGTRLQWPSGVSTHTATSTLRDTGVANGVFDTSVVLRITIL